MTIPASTFSPLLIPCTPVACGTRSHSDACVVRRWAWAGRVRGAILLLVGLCLEYWVLMKVRSSTKGRRLLRSQLIFSREIVD